MSVNCVPTGIGPLAVGWCSHAHSVPTTCLVPGRVTRLLQEGPPRCRVAVHEREHCVLCVYNMRLRGIFSLSVGEARGSREQVSSPDLQIFATGGYILWRQSDRGGLNLNAATFKSQWKSACSSLSPSVCLPVHLHPKLQSLFL